MKIVAILETPSGRRLRLKSQGKQASRELETYFSPREEIAIYCANHESEEFERDTGSRLESDVLTAAQFAKLAGWLSENAQLGASGVYSAV